MTPSMDNAAETSTPPAVQRMITLLLTNLGLSVVLAVLFALFHNSLLNYQLGHLGPIPASAMGSVRDGLSAGLWSRAGTVAIVGVVYLFLVRQLRSGKRRAYLRVLVLSVVNIAVIAYIASSGQYPTWVIVEQIVQGVVLLGLLWAATRPAVRGHFAKRVPAAA